MGVGRAYPATRPPNHQNSPPQIRRIGVAVDNLQIVGDKLWIKEKHHEHLTGEPLIIIFVTDLLHPMLRCRDRNRSDHWALVLVALSTGSWVAVVIAVRCLEMMLGRL